MKFSSRLLAELALSILLDPTSPYTAQSRDPKDDALLTSKFTPTWIQQFMHIHSIMLLSQRGRLTCSLEKELQIERATVYHLGVLQRGFGSGNFDENLMENVDEPISSSIWTTAAHSDFGAIPQSSMPKLSLEESR